MILALLILIPLSGGILAWLANSWNRNLSRWISLISITADLVMVSALLVMNYSSIGCI